MEINIPDLEVAYLSSHEGFTKLRYFWFQYWSSASLVRMNYSAIIYDFAYCIQTQQTILELKETES